MRPHILIKAVIFFCCVVVLAAFVVPDERPEADDYEIEKFQYACLSPTDDVLLLRSRNHDYEFSLPPNALNAAFALDLGRPIRCYFDHVSFNSYTQEASIEFRAYFGRYSEPLTEDARDALAPLGFVQSDRHAHFMAWTEGRDLRGRRYPAGSRPELTGTDLSRCVNNRRFYNVVLSIDPEAARRNRCMNRLTSPFRAVRAGLTTGFNVLKFTLFG